MPEDPMTTAARKIDRLERQTRGAAALQSGHGIGDVFATYLALPELRGFWPFTSINESGHALDLSGQGRTLTNNGGATRVMRADTLVSYTSVNGSTQYWSRASEAGLTFASNLTVLLWRWGSQTDAVQRNLISKDGWALYYYGGALAWWCNNGATTGYTSQAGVADSKWHFICARYTPSTSVQLTVDDTTTTSTTTIPAALATGAGAFSTGSTTSGHLALLAVCAAVLTDAFVARLYRLTRGLFAV